MRRLRAIVALTTALLLLATTPAGALTSRLLSVSFASPTDGVLAGGYDTLSRQGFISVTADGGATWRPYSAAPNTFLTSVSAYSTTDYWALSSFSQTPLRTTTGGSDLGAVPTAIASGAGGGTVDLADVASFGPGDAIAVGERLDALLPGEYEGDMASMWRTTDGGTTWSRVYEGPRYPLNAEGGTVSSQSRMESADHAEGTSTLWALGNLWQPDTQKTDVDFAGALIMKSGNLGSTWTTQTVSGVTRPLRDVVAVSDTVAFAVGRDRQFLATFNGGTTWTRQQLARDTVVPGNQGVTAVELSGVDALDANNIVAVGEQGKVVHSIDGGATWKYFTLPAVGLSTRFDLWSVQLLSPTQAVAVGDDETIVRLTFAADGSVSAWSGNLGPKAPSVAFTQPGAGFSLGASGSGPIAVSGTAADPGTHAPANGVGVTSVQLRIKRTNTGTSAVQYWTGSSWAAGEQWVDATTSNAFATWQYSWAIDDATRTGYSVAITARARDAVDNAAEASRFSAGAPADTTPPSVITDGKATYTGSATIRIDATDAGSGVKSVSYRLASQGVTQTVSGSSATVFTTRVGPDTLYFTATDNADNTKVPAGQLAFTVNPGAPTVTPKRVADTSRYNTAVAIAREGFDKSGTKTWPGVTDVVVASGEDRAAADPLAASGLCWLYDAPLLLVSSKGVDPSVTQAINEIRVANGPVNVWVVGGPVSVPQSVMNTLGVAAGKTPARLLATGGRYDMAAKIATTMKAESGAQGKSLPSVALFANGADPAKFFDALSLSPIAARTGAPILLVSATAVPPATASAVSALSPAVKVVGGGPNTVQNSVLQTLNTLGGDTFTERWAGTTRYSTATAIADKAIAAGWLDDASIAVAAKLPDALSGGGMIGRAGGPLLLTSSTALSSETAAWLSAHKAGVSACWVFGGTNSVAPSVLTAIGSALN